ncbi:MAG: hypothetical protein J0I90_07750 [Nitrosospira sp.]|nr:hypothetical protein [Nitrosospira sp.]
MAVRVVKERGIAIKRACGLFSISETCYRYHATLSGDNARISDWLLRLAYANRTWGFGLCFLWLRNVKGMPYNHKRVYRIYRQLELNLRIKPKQRLKRDKSQALAVPQRINEVWSMDFMHDALSDDGQRSRYGGTPTKGVGATSKQSRIRSRGYSRCGQQSEQHYSYHRPEGRGNIWDVGRQSQI